MPAATLKLIYFSHELLQIPLDQLSSSTLIDRKNNNKCPRDHSASLGNKNVDGNNVFCRTKILSSIRKLF
jgi:hypothetical protein